MEHRFGFRELVICVLLVLLIVCVWLAMVELDRQGIQLRQMSTAITEQTSDLARIRRLLEQGIQVQQAPTTQAAATNPVTTTLADGWQGDGVDPFRRIKAAEKMPGYARGDDFVSALRRHPRRRSRRSSPATATPPSSRIT